MNNLPPPPLDVFFFFSPQRTPLNRLPVYIPTPPDTTRVYNSIILHILTLYYIGHGAGRVRIGRWQTHLYRMTPHNVYKKVYT